MLPFVNLQLKYSISKKIVWHISKESINTFTFNDIPKYATTYKFIMSWHGEIYITNASTDGEEENVWVCSLDDELPTYIRYIKKNNKGLFDPIKQFYPIRVF